MIQNAGDLLQELQIDLKNRDLFLSTLNGEAAGEPADGPKYIRRLRSQAQIRSNYWDKWPVQNINVKFTTPLYFFR